jgi:hypothetical protein
MTVRNQQYVAWLAMALTLAAMGVKAFNASKGDWQSSETIGVVGLAPALVMLGIVLAKYRRLEAEHGSDYRPPMTGGRTLILAVVAAAVLGAIAVWLIATR